MGFTITEIFHQLYACANHSISHVGFGINSYDYVQNFIPYISTNFFTVLVFVHLLVNALSTCTVFYIVKHASTE